MKIIALSEKIPGEKRASLNPATTEKLVKLGAEVLVEPGLGAAIHFADADYVAKGARLITDRTAALA